MSENLILFTITPVQQFITTARKTEDLWLGSYILSHLNATAIEQIYNRDGVEIIYPAIGDGSPFEFWEGADLTLPSFPNLFLARSEELSIGELTCIMKFTENVVQTEFKQMARHAVEIFVQTVNNRAWDNTYADQLFEKQINNFLQLYWVISNKGENDYKEWYARTTAQLASIKNCRVFQQVSENGRKCSLCGQRGIFHNGQRAPMEWWKRFAQRRVKYCRPGEALCTVCLTKRLAKLYFEDRYDDFKTHTFPSTSEISTADFKHQIVHNTENLGKYEEFVESVESLRNTDGYSLKGTTDPVPKLRSIQKDWNNVDGDWLFEGAFSKQNLERYYGVDRDVHSSTIEKCERLRRGLLQDIGVEPSPYFAVILLDGDGMGEIISQVKDAEAHAKISRQLNKYTLAVKQIVDSDYLGKLLYAGGDDVLALANLKDLLDILHQLRKKFPNLTPCGSSASTASAGVCIAHCKMPLSDVLTRTRKMERAAKAVDGKNALGIALIKHSGNVSQTVFKWKYKIENGSDCLDMMEVSRNLVELLKKGEVSKKFLYTFREAFTRLTNQDGEFEFPDILAAELKRLIWRAASEKARSDTEIKERIDKNVQDLTALLRKSRMKFADLVSFLEIINFIAREDKTE